MSKPQKLLVSVLGALIAHLLLVFGIALLLTVGGVIGPSEIEAASKPEEVTIMLSELIPEPPSEEPGKQYVRTDPDQQADRPPESARFESDRDTLAATQMLPDPSAEAIEDMPTIAGREDMPSLELRDRDFSKGEAIELPPPASAASQPSPPSSVLPPVSSANPAAAASAAASSAMQASKSKAETESKQTVEASAVGRADADGKRDADTETKGKSENEALAEGKADETRRTEAMLAAENTEAETEESFADPLAADDAPQIGRDQGSMDRQATTDRESEVVGSPTDASAAAGGSSAPTEAPAVGGAMATAAQPPATASVATPGEDTDTPAFVPITRANEVSGTLSNLGKKAALNVEATELGRYKKSVVSAIEQEWHRYRLSNMDDITAGNLRLRFRVDSQGKVRNLKIMRDEANVGMTEFTLKAILAAKIPAMPEDVANALGSEGLIMNYTILVAY